MMLVIGSAEVISRRHQLLRLLEQCHEATVS